MSLPPLQLSGINVQFKELQRSNRQLNAKIENMKKKEEAQTARNLTFAPSSHCTPRSDPSRFPSEYLLGSSTHRHFSEASVFESGNTERLLQSNSPEAASLSVVHCERGKENRRVPSTNLKENQIAVYLPCGMSGLKRCEDEQREEFFFVLSLKNKTTVSEIKALLLSQVSSF